MSKYQGLGKGLSALINDIADNMSDENITSLPIKILIPNPLQPRKDFDVKELGELADSISRVGVLQAIIVKKLENSEQYQILAGERRWRASQIAGLDTIPVLVKNVSKQKSMEIALIENIQRQDLNILEEAESYSKLIEEFHYTQETLAKIMSKSRSHIANLLRILTLPSEITEKIRNGKLSMGHARALINIKNNSEIADIIINENLNVRQTEALVRNYNPNNKKNFQTKTEDVISLEKAISNSLGLRVEIEENSKGGKISIYYNNLQHLDRVIQKLADHQPLHENIK